MEQPGLVIIAAQKVFVTVGSTAINFSISGTLDDNLYKVSEADFIACLKIEEVFEQLNWRPFEKPASNSAAVAYHQPATRSFTED